MYIHVMVCGTGATTGSEPLKYTASESNLSDILALPKPKKSQTKKKAWYQSENCLFYR